MTRLFRLQRLMAVLFAAAAALMFLHALYFMTEYKDLFGLELPKNKPVAQFHDVLMQGYNKQLLWFALLGLSAAGVSFLLEVAKAVPDRFALAVLTVLLTAVCGCSVWALCCVPFLRETYVNLDFQYLRLEGAANYTVRTFPFVLCFAMHAFNAAVCVAYGAVLWLSHFKFKLEEPERA